ncbi:hypothetical protein [Oceanobacillus massiliensis]|uniref:hypothetical protein n=1 Tax=Oceanobacillus massiliensis TaxID=1465765 RepID=UPI00301A7977
MKKIFVAGYDGMDFDDIVTFTVDDELQYDDALVNEIYKKEWDFIIENLCLEDFIEMMEGNKDELFRLAADDFEQFKKNFIYATTLSDYKFKYYDDDPLRTPYLVMDKDESDFSHAKVLFADNEEDLKRQVVEKFAKSQVEMPYFREFVESREAFDLAEYFWKVDGISVWNQKCYSNEIYSDYVLNKYNNIEHKIIEGLLIEEFKDNVKRFFDNEEYSQQYIGFYFSEDAEPCFSNDFYYTVSKNLYYKTDNWVDWDIREIEV